MGAFCISPKKRGNIQLQFTNDDGANNNNNNRILKSYEDLTLRIYRDTNWTSYDKAKRCDDRVALSVFNYPIASSNKNTTKLHTNNNNNNNNKKHHHGNNNDDRAISVYIDNTKQDRPHYYYIVITACSMGEQILNDDSKTFPSTHYVLEVTNNGSHLSADELHLNVMHMVTLFVSGILGTLLALMVLIRFYEKNTVHAAVLWVMTAAFSDSFASLLAIIHLELYAHNGIGSPLMDSLSCHLEATTDSLVAILLLSIAAGWTLPSDVVKIQQNAPRLKVLLKDLQSPFRAIESASPTAMLLGFVFLSHVFLAQWGLHYHNNDFDSYHDLENLPGKILMILRVFEGLCFWICCVDTKLQCPTSLIGFYNKLLLVGSLWFLSLPILMWIVDSFVAVHLRHRTIGVWGASLQMISIALLSWLVTAHSTKYHRLSHLSTTPQDSLTESLGIAATGEGGFRTWRIMGKAKVRLD